MKTARIMTLAALIAGSGLALHLAGQALFIPAGTIHAAKNVGAANAARSATYIVEKSKPLVTLDK